MLSDHLDQPDDVVVERSQFLCGNPQLDVLATADLMRLVSSRKDAETRHIADVARGGILRVPVAGDLRRVLLAENR